MPTRIFFLLFSILILPYLAQAHKIHVFAWVSGNTITVESSFSGNRPLLNGSVTVQNNASKTILLEGTGDESGIFTFSIPAIAREEHMDLLVVVSGGDGHQSQWLIPATEYLAEAAPAPAPPTVQSIAPPENDDELKRMIQELLIQELAPIKRSLAAAEDKKPGFRDIMGGIGYLLGLAGLVAWLKNRSPQDLSKK